MDVCFIMKYVSHADKMQEKNYVTNTCTPITQLCEISTLTSCLILGMTKTHTEIRTLMYSSASYGALPALPRANDSQESSVPHAHICFYCIFVINPILEKRKVRLR